LRQYCHHGPTQPRRLGWTKVALFCAGTKMSSIAEYVLGFYFVANRQAVVLIRKNKPEWQAGKFNGVGGRIEPGETALEAMRREFREEACKDVTSWRPFATMEFPDAIVHCFTADGDRTCIRSGTDEKLHLLGLSTLRFILCIPNLRWLIPMAMMDCRPEIAHIRFEPLN